MPLASRVVDLAGGTSDGRDRRRHGELARLGVADRRRDLLVEWRSRVALNQVLPFAAVVMVMFGFAIDDTSLMRRISPGLIVLATTFSLLLLVQRSFTVEREDGALDALRTRRGSPVGAVLGQDGGAGRRARRARGRPPRPRRAAVQRRDPSRPGCSLLVTWVVATVALATVGTLYGGLAAGARGGDAAPAAAAPSGGAGSDRSNPSGRSSARRRASGHGRLALDGLVAVFAVVFGAGGTLAFGPLIEDET